MRASRSIFGLSVALCCLSCCEPYPGEMEYVDFFLTVEITDSVGTPTTCGALNIVRIFVGSENSAQSTCCDPETSSVIINVKPYSYAAGAIGAGGFNSDGLGVADGRMYRADGDMEGTLVLAACEGECGTYDAGLCADPVGTVQ